MPRDCPACGTVNPDTATVCDCGYDFVRPVPIEGGGPQRPSILVGLLSIVLLLISAVCLWLAAFAGITPEDELTLVEGVPSDANVSTLKLGRNTSNTLHFKVGGVSTEYGSGSPKFKEVVEAVAREEPLQIWVSTKPGLLVEREHAPLFKLSVDGKPILTYSDMIDKEQEGHVAGWVCGSFSLAVGVWAASMWFRARSRYAAWIRLESASQSRSGGIVTPEM